MTKGVSILGEHISVVRPERINKPIVYQDDHPTQGFCRRKFRAKRNKENSGKVLLVVLMLTDDTICGMATVHTHLEVLEAFSLEPEEVEKTGWLLENGNYVWR